jgi:hypothetical protein
VSPTGDVAASLPRHRADSESDGAGKPGRVRARSAGVYPGVGRECEEVTPHPRLAVPPPPSEKENTVFTRLRA